jgi:hypothetical protein
VRAEIPAPLYALCTACAEKSYRVAAMGSAIIGQRCMLSDEGVAMLGRRHHHQLGRTGTIVGLKGDNYVVRWDGNAKETVQPYARRYIEVIQPVPKAPQS